MKKITKSHHFKNFIVLKISLIFVAAGILLIFYTTTTLPTIDLLDKISNQQSIILTDRNDNILFNFEANERKIKIKYDEISENLIKAVVATEDKNYFEHNGVQFASFFRALAVNLKEFSFSQGGSTITQQVVKNIFLTRNKKITRKLKEFSLAYKLEKELSKEEILELYFNTISYGGTIYGLGEATKVFFNKTPKEITLSEAAYLAAIPKAPTYFSPYGSHINELVERKNYVLRQILGEKLITLEEYIHAKNENIYFNKKSKENGIRAPHFVFYVQGLLEKKYGNGLNYLYGKTIKTTLDIELQNKIETIIVDLGKKLEGLGVNNTASVVLSAKTGEILAMIGSKDYFNEEIDGTVNVITSKRQPGSTIKPFVYSKAFEKGYTPDTVLFDVETEFNPGCEVEEIKTENDEFANTELNKDDGKKLSIETNCYTPKNFDDKFVGPVSLRSALARSKNIPTIKLLYLVSIKTVFELLKSTNIASITNPYNFGLTFALGAAEVTPLELANAYSIFPNDGVFVEKKVFIDDERNKIKQKRVLSKLAAQTINDILSDDEARAPAFGSKGLLYFKNHDVAIKTGTTNWSRDFWVIGYSPDVIVLLWGGNTRGEIVLKKIFGYTLVPHFRQIMDIVLAKYGSPNSVFNKTEFFTGYSQALYGNYLDAEGKPHSILHYINKESPTKGIPVFDEDPQYKNWEIGVKNFFKKLNINF